jgi:hypothetical protein
MFIIDRMEDEIAVIEGDELIFKLPIILLPKGIKEGDVIEIMINRNGDLTEARKKEANKLLNELLQESERSE